MTWGMGYTKTQLIFAHRAWKLIQTPLSRQQYCHAIQEYCMYSIASICTVLYLPDKWDKSLQRAETLQLWYWRSTGEREEVL